MRTTGDQTYLDTVTVGGPVTGFNGVNVDFDQTLDGASDVTVTASGTTTFNGDVGGTTPLLSLTTDALGTTVVNGALVDTANDQFFGDAVTVGGPATEFAGTNVALPGSVPIP